MDSDRFPYLYVNGDKYDYAYSDIYTNTDTYIHTDKYGKQYAYTVEHDNSNTNRNGDSHMDTNGNENVDADADSLTHPLYDCDCYKRADFYGHTHHYTDANGHIICKPKSNANPHAATATRTNGLDAGMER